MSLIADQLTIDKDHRAVLFILLIPVVVLLVNGYRYGVGDQSHYIPMIYRLVDPALFPNDILFDQPSGSYSFWLPAVSTLARFFPLEWIFFIGHLLATFALFWAIYHLSLHLFQVRMADVLPEYFSSLSMASISPCTRTWSPALSGT